MNRHSIERIIRNVLAFFAFLSVLILALIVFFLFQEGVPLFRQVSVFDFVFGMHWYPTYDPPEYGIWPLIVGSLLVTLFSCLIAVPLGVLSAIYIAEIAPPSIKEVLKAVIELVPPDENEAGLKARAERRAWLTERGYRVVDVAMVDVERNVGDALNGLAAALAITPSAP